MKSKILTSSRRDKNKSPNAGADLRWKSLTAKDTTESTKNATFANGAPLREAMLTAENLRALLRQAVLTAENLRTLLRQAVLNAEDLRAPLRQAVLNAEYLRAVRKIVKRSERAVSLAQGDALWKIIRVSPKPQRGVSVFWFMITPLQGLVFDAVSSHRAMPCANDAALSERLILNS